VTNSK